jgi:TPP-dependent pyruvate/acetoin dehydrogenase alpha subunit
MAGVVSPAPASADRELGLDLYRRMRLIRRFEDTIQSLFQKGEVHGTTHLYSGEEAVAVGVASALGDADRAAGTYRGHGHALALGVEPQTPVARPSWMRCSGVRPASAAGGRVP